MLRADLFNSELDCWIDASDIQAGQRLNPAIESAIAGSNLFFAYVTDDFLRSRWCMAEIRYALHSARVTLAPYVDSQETLDAVPSDLLNEVAFGRIAQDNYLRSALEIQAAPGALSRSPSCSFPRMITYSQARRYSIPAATAGLSIDRAARRAASWPVPTCAAG